MVRGVINTLSSTPTLDSEPALYLIPILDPIQVFLNHCFDLRILFSAALLFDTAGFDMDPIPPTKDAEVRIQFQDVERGNNAHDHGFPLQRYNTDLSIRSVSTQMSRERATSASVAVEYQAL